MSALNIVHANHYHWLGTALEKLSDSVTVTRWMLCNPQLRIIPTQLNGRVAFTVVNGLGIFVMFTSINALIEHAQKELEIL
jgi:hypothetical protein